MRWKWSFRLFGCGGGPDLEAQFGIVTNYDPFAAGDDSRRFRRELGCPFGSEHSDRCWPLVEVGETIDQRERYELVAIATEDGLAHKVPQRLRLLLDWQDIGLDVVLVIGDASGRNGQTTASTASLGGSVLVGA